MIFLEFYNSSPIQPLFLSATLELYLNIPVSITLGFAVNLISVFFSTPCLLYFTNTFLSIFCCAIAFFNWSRFEKERLLIDIIISPFSRPLIYAGVSGTVYLVISAKSS